MKTKIAVGFVIGLLVLGPVLASDASVSNKGTFENAGKQASGLHASLLPHAAPAVRSKLSASAAAGRSYLAKCGQNCQLYTFLSNDLKKRFTKLSRQELDLLITLAFGEIAGGATSAELSALRVQQLVQDHNSMITLVTKVMATEHSTLMSVIQNIRP